MIRFFHETSPGDFAIGFGVLLKEHGGESPSVALLIGPWIFGLQWVKG